MCVIILHNSHSRLGKQLGRWDLQHSVGIRCSCCLNPRVPTISTGNGLNKVLELLHYLFQVYSSLWRTTTMFYRMYANHQLIFLLFYRMYSATDSVPNVRGSDDVTKKWSQEYLTIEPRQAFNCCPSLQRKVNVKFSTRFLRNLSYLEMM